VTIVSEVILIVFISVALISNFFGIPGNLLIALNAFIYGIITRFDDFSFAFVLSLFIIVVALEFLEYLLISLTARKYGASKIGVAGGIFGGVLGGISGAFITPVLGAIIGSVIGVFVGAVSLEFLKSYKLKVSLYKGFGAFLGKIGGLSIKVCGAVTMTIMISYKIF